MTSYPTRFTSVNDLSRLPWFEVRAGALVVADPSVPEAIDMHTHLALAFLRPMQVDLGRATPRTEAYLPTSAPIDFELYQNRNFSPEALARMERDLSLGSLGKGDMRATHTVPNLVRDMGALKIRQSVLLAIDLPFGLSNNAKAWLDAARGNDELVVYGSVHPFDSDVEGKLDAQVALGARGIKVHPAVQLVKPDAKRCLALFRACGARGLPVFFHCGPVDIETKLGRYFSQVRHYERAIAECPSTRFVLGHSGALQLDQGIALAKRYPNVWLELASQSLPGVRTLVEQAPEGRLGFGTDWPFYDQSIGLAKVLIATDGDLGARRRILHDNAAELLARSA